MFKTFPTFKICYVVCDANTFLGATVMERYESLYVKIFELTSVLLEKGAMQECLTLVVPPYMSERFSNSSTDESGQQFVQWFNRKWIVRQDANLPKDQVEIESDIGKALLVVVNFPEVVGIKEKN